MEPPITKPVSDISLRRTAILESATRAFSLNGLRGSSLREIAKDAGVSLTLVDHYFGTKAMLLEAVVSERRQASAKKISALRASLARPDATPSLKRLIDEWADYEFDLSITRQGRHGLNLMVRLSFDPEVDPALRAKINSSEEVFIEAYGVLRPDLDGVRINGAWLLASGAMYEAVLNLDGLYGSTNGTSAAGFRADTKRFVANGLKDWGVSHSD